MSRFATARKFAVALANRSRHPVFIWVAVSNPERFFVLEIGKEPTEPSNILERVLPQPRKVP